MSINEPIDFFKKKQKWSIIKDQLLCWYLKPYIAKISSRFKNFYFIDGFAGSGKFDDDSLGSPLLVNKIISETINKKCKFTHICIEKDKKIYSKLCINTKNLNNVVTLNSSLAESLLKLEKTIEQKAAVFIYLDPFGINGLSFDLTNFLKKRKDLRVEILINFNSFGCFRECSRLLKQTLFDTFFIENNYLIDKNSSAERMTELLASDAWKNCFIKNKPEYFLSELFVNKLKSSFKYVLNIPIRLSTNNIPKYRMIYCSNSADGAILMADNMYMRLTENIPSIFKTNLEGEIIDIDNYITKIVNYIPDFPNKPIVLSEIIANFYENEGVAAKPKEICVLLNKLEQQGLINVIRKPAFSITGKKTKFWSDYQNILLSRKI